LRFDTVRAQKTLQKLTTEPGLIGFETNEA
jgi:hypothetical protein